MVGIDAAASQCRQRFAGSNMRSRAPKLLAARQFGATTRKVRSTSVSRPSRGATGRLSAAKAALFNHLVGTQKERLRDCESERLGGFEIDD